MVCLGERDYDELTQPLRRRILRPQRRNFAPLNQSAQAQATLLQRVSYLLCTALLCTAGAAYVSRDWSPALGLPLLIGTFVCVIGLNFVKTTTARRRW